MCLFQFWFLWCVCPAVGLLGHMAFVHSIFKGLSTLVSKVAVLVCIPTNSVRGFPFLHTSPAFIFCRHFDGSHSDWLEMAMATHSITLTWEIPWTEEPGRLQFMGSQRVVLNWATSLSLFTFMCWRRKWQPTPALLSGEFHGPRSLVGYSSWGHKESDTTERLHSLTHSQ